MDELQIALPTASYHPQVTNENRPFRSAVLELCSPFVCLDSDNIHIRLIHQSAQEYLSGDHEFIESLTLMPMYLMNTKIENTRLALHCVKYIKSIQPSIYGESSLDAFGQYSMLSWCHHTLKGAYSAELEYEIFALLDTPEYVQSWLFWTLFLSEKPYPFQEIFRLQLALQVWSQSSSTSEPPNLRLCELDWSMAVLELLIKLGQSNNKIQQDRQMMDRSEISYFDKMMVVRDLSRRLTQNGSLSRAVENLEHARITSTCIPHIPFSSTLLQSSMISNLVLTFLYKPIAKHSPRKKFISAQSIHKRSGLSMNSAACTGISKAFRNRKLCASVLSAPSQRHSTKTIQSTSGPPTRSRPRTGHRENRMLRFGYTGVRTSCAPKV